MVKRYLVRFANELLNFRLSEFESLASYFNLQFSWVEQPTDKPFYIVETDNESALKQVLHRSVLAQSLYELWVSASTFEQFREQLVSSKQVQDPTYSQCSFRIMVDTFGKKISMQTKVQRIERLDFLPFYGPIQLKDADVTFHYFEYFGHDRMQIPELPYQIIFGRWLADSNRKLISKFSLKTRKFIANTSMEPTLAFLMSNIAMIGPNDLVYDPFVGSGSLLVSAACHGAYVYGTDIDYLLLHGLVKPSRCGVKQREQDESVLGNLTQYQLQSRYLDVISADSSLPLLRPGFLLDAILTDPPYGKRESRERIGTNKNNKIPQQLLATHIPSKLEYRMHDIYRDLMDFAAQHLKIDGKLLFWAPYANMTAELNEDEEEENTLRSPKPSPLINFVPEANSIDLEHELKCRFSHPQLRFVSYSSQNLSNKLCRILITMQRIL